MASLAEVAAGEVVVAVTLMTMLDSVTEPKQSLHWQRYPHIFLYVHVCIYM